MAALSLSTTRGRPQTARPSPFDPRALPSYRLLAMMAALIVTLALVLGFAGDRQDLPTFMTMQVVLVLIALIARGRGAGRIATAIEAAMLVMAATMAAGCLSMLVGTTAYPYRDALLEGTDRWLVPGYSWFDMFVALHRQDQLITTMCGIYHTLQWQPFLLVALLALSGREQFCWRFVQAWFVALAACVVVFPFVPALGPYVHHGLLPADIPSLTVTSGWRAVEVLGHVRDGTLRALEPAKMTGLVSFPSFHAAGSVLLFWAFRRIPVVGPAFMALNVAMCMTAPLIGAHYFTDIAGGICIALIAIAAVRPADAPALLPFRFPAR